jgi:2-C-methyl-D-erythritol 4-phosphate cytidylyltransferase
MSAISKRYWVIIPAAGSGDRFSNNTPKQYVRLLGKTILEHTISLFSSKPWVKKILIPLSKNDPYFGTLPCAKEEKILTLQGGETRLLSVLYAVQHIKEITHEWEGTDKVLVHDAVRPCLHEEDLQDFIQNMQENEGGALLAMRSQDTMKWVSQTKTLYTVDRNSLWHALTPQCFPLDHLEAVLTHCERENWQVTDEASAFEQCGHYPKIVEAKHLNPKLTYPRDTEIISLLLAKRQQKEGEVL